MSDLRCPLTGTALALDATRELGEQGEEVVEGFLVAVEGQALWLILAGIGILVPDLDRHVKDHGNVYRRIPIADSRVARAVLGRAGRGLDDRVPIEELVGRYGDLIQPGELDEMLPMLPEDAALARLLAEHAGDAARALDVGCGLGRGAFVLRGFARRVLGIDRSVARVRRARNIAATDAHFFLPAPKDSGRKEVPIDLTQLTRRGVDFAVADGGYLPLRDGCIEILVLRAGDLRGPWDDTPRAISEALRVLAPSGLLIAEDALAIEDPSLEQGGGEDGFQLYRRAP